MIPKNTTLLQDLNHLKTLVHLLKEQLRELERDLLAAQKKWDREVRQMSLT